MPEPKYLWLDGKFVRYGDANVHILTHSLQYGSGIFEGIRCYKTESGPAIFRLHDHIVRLFDSAKIYGMPTRFNIKEVEEGACSTIRRNNLKSAYIRPFIFYTSIGIGYNVKGKSTSVAIAALEFGNLFEGKHSGLNCKITTWQRINSSILPPGAKASGNYLNSILASQEANNSGYDEAILITAQGHVAEGPGENIFAVKDRVLITPPKSAGILLGITRDTIIKIAKSTGLEVEERDMRREELYTSDEVFFSGTAAEITPILSVDSRAIGNAKPGPITTLLSNRYSRIVNGEDKEFAEWLTPVS
ncbi:MAG: branched-chain amino acid transaminase [Candidatus Marsarchaeota archaeon]|nr:branched-chain amino acid transaminase [Candidatus Marsarchaeota archaeon]MCL5413299.1 branched-chain amino acid transaminase [Candidatus Marsarchaeota archaeon]